MIAASILGIVSACGSDDGGDSSSTEAAAAGSSAPATTSGSAEASATTAAGPGVLSWWVQTRAKADTDTCTDAEKLLAATLSSDL